MPPKVGSSAAMMSHSLSGSSSLISISNTSMPANFLNSTPLPSITGLAASGPILPRPSTAVPLVMTATRLPRAVYLNALAGSTTISSQADGHARRICQGQIALVGQLLGRRDADFSGRRKFVIFERGMPELLTQFFFLVCVEIHTRLPSWLLTKSV